MLIVCSPAPKPWVVAPKLLVVAQSTHALPSLTLTALQCLPHPLQKHPPLQVHGGLSPNVPCTFFSMLYLCLECSSILFPVGKI